MIDEALRYLADRVALAQQELDDRSRDWRSARSRMEEGQAEVARCREALQRYVDQVTDEAAKRRSA